MRSLALAVVVCALLSDFGLVSASARAQERQGPMLDLVEIVGCLTEGPAQSWLVVNGTEPVATEVPWTTEAAVRNAAVRPLGQRRYRLIGVSAFGPSERQGHKVAVKGVLIEDADEQRINVTSLQTASPTCTS